MCICVFVNVATVVMAAVLQILRLRPAVFAQDDMASEDLRSSLRMTWQVKTFGLPQDDTTSGDLRLSPG